MTTNPTYKRETYNKHEAFATCRPYSTLHEAPKPGERAAFKWWDRKHTPQNKRFGQVESWTQLEVIDNPEGHNSVGGALGPSAPVHGWTQISLEETTRHGDRAQTRTISVCLSHDAREALFQYLLNSRTQQL